MVDTQARKLLLLTRIAAERQELMSDVKQLRGAASLPSMLRSAVGPGLIADLLGPKPGGRQSGSGGRTDWLGLGLKLVRRYRVAATVVGSLVTLLRGRSAAAAGTPRRRRGGTLRRLGLLAIVGGAAFAGWKFSKPGAGAGLPR